MLEQSWRCLEAVKDQGILVEDFVELAYSLEVQLKFFVLFAESALVLDVDLRGEHVGQFDGSVRRGDSRAQVVNSFLF